MEKRELEIASILKNKSGVIEFKSYHGLNTHKRRVRPKKNENSRWFHGVPVLSEDIKKSGKAHVDPEDPENTLAVTELAHGKKMDLGNEFDRMVLNWLLLCDNTVALTYEEGINNPKQTFYVYNRELDTQKRVKKLEIKDDAIYKLRSLTQDDLYSVVRLLGYKMASSTPEEIRLFIRELFEDPKKGIETASKFLDIINDTSKEIKIFIHKCLDAAIISKTERGEFKYNDIFLGLSFPAVISWMESKENQDLVYEIKNSLGEPIKKPSTSTRTKK